MGETNRQVVLVSHPVGFPKESDFKMVESPVPKPAEGQFLVRHEFMSLDPYMRGRMNPPSKLSYAAGVKPGDVMQGGSVGRVISSRNPDFAEGDYVATFGGWQEYCLADGKGYHEYKIDPKMAPVEAYLGILGMPGMTAYFGLLDLCNPKPGETVFVSGAAGAVGSYVGQIAKLKGCRVVGSAGGDDKVELMTSEFGYDAGFNYKSTSNYNGELQRLCPNGIDCYFDNVGGAISDAVFYNMNLFARIAICGQISQYNLEKPQMGPRILSLILVRQARVEGFIVTRFLDRYPEAFREMAKWLSEGRLVYKTTVAEGIENAPRAFLGMLRGENIGKQLVRFD